MTNFIHSYSPLNSYTLSIPASNLVYVYANLRDIVLKHGMTSDKNIGKDIVKFEQPELIVTQKSDERRFKTTLLKYNVSATAILKFVDLNRKHLKLESGSLAFDKTGSNTDSFYFENGLQTLKNKFESEIVEFNDEEKDKELLYAVVVNRYVICNYILETLSCSF